MMRSATLVLIAMLPAAAQNTSSYGPDHIWWSAGQGGVLPWEENYDNPDGQAGIVNRNGAVRTDGHPFFEALGSNGRACVTCHQPSNAMSVSAAALEKRWIETKGKDPVFAAIDGSNCPDLPQAERRSHSLLLERGLFRIALPWPPLTMAGTPIQAEFGIEVVRDPTGCNNSRVYGLQSAHPSISVYRRPRITANLQYVVEGAQGMSFMADAREPSLRAQAITAVMVHEQPATEPSPEQLRRIIEFETQIYAAQRSDIRGGLLNENSGPPVLGPQNLAAGGTGGLGGDPARLAFATWRTPAGAAEGVQGEFRASAARGSQLFFFRRLDSEGRTCASCHRAGGTRWMDIGTANRGAETASPDLPLFRVTCNNGRVIHTQDPGRALITGKCSDVGAIVIQQLRGLAARAPYFANGSAATLRDVVDFYDRRFRAGYTEQEKQDLVNFLKVL